MRTRLLITAVVLALALPVAAEFRTVQRAHEVEPADIRLPQNERGTLAFRDCAECAFTVKRVTAETRWILNGRPVRLDQFRTGLAAAADSERVSLIVLHHLEMDRITEVSATVR